MAHALGKHRALSRLHSDHNIWCHECDRECFRPEFPCECPALQGFVDPREHVAKASVHRYCLFTLFVQVTFLGWVPPPHARTGQIHLPACLAPSPPLPGLVLVPLMALRRGLAQQPARSAAVWPGRFCCLGNVWHGPCPARPVHVFSNLAGSFYN